MTPVLKTCSLNCTCFGCMVYTFPVTMGVKSLNELKRPGESRKSRHKTLLTRYEYRRLDKRLS